MADEGLGGVVEGIEGVTIDEASDGSMIIDIEGKDGTPIHIVAPD